MTIEEKATAYAESRITVKCPRLDKLITPNEKRIERFDGYDIEQAYEDGATEALASQWRSVEEELPEENVYLLVRCSDVYYPEICCCLACFLHGGWVFFDDFYRGCTVSHWMPIPPLLTTKNQEKQI